jgi:drug/metabolite transporter (DMT)-like permease
VRKGSHALPDSVRGMLLMVASTVLFAFMIVCIRLAAEEVHAFEATFFRSFFGLVFAVPLLLGGGWRSLRTTRLNLYFIRCLIGVGAMLSGFWALVHMPLVQAIALSYTSPLFVTIGAAMVLGEAVRARRWTAVVIGFIGVLVILRPGLVPFTPAAVVALVSAALTAGAAISIKFLSRTEPTEAIVVYMVLLMTPMCLVAAAPVWVWPTSGVTWLCLVLTGFFGTTAHWFLTRAYKLGDASALTPVNFVQLPVVAVIAWVLFEERIDLWTIVGAAIICGSTLYIAHREARLESPQVTDPGIARETSAH